MTYVLPHEHRILVGVEVPPSHDAKHMLPTFENNIYWCIARLQTFKHVPMLILQRYHSFL